VAGRKIVKKCFPRAAEAVISREFSLPPRGMRFGHLRQTLKSKALWNNATGFPPEADGLTAGGAGG
ncbi:MAG: hypothetical protein ACUVQK_14010, partial [Thermogutta sp.]